MSATQGAAARLAAAQELRRILGGGSATEGGSIADHGLPARDQAFARHLVFGVLRWLSALDWLLGALLERPLRARDAEIAWLLRIGLYQLWRDDTPAHAAVHATVAAVKQSGKPWAGKLANAVLRSFQRQRDGLLDRLAQEPERLAHPDWLLEQLRRDWPDDWESIADANNLAPPLWLRINRRKTNRDAYAALLAERGFEAHWSDAAPEAVRIEPAVAVESVPGFTEGLASVQDVAAQRAVAFLEAAAGHRVLDACAAPGGKTCHILETTPEVELTAIDRDPQRLVLVRENLDRLGLDCRLLAADAGEPGRWAEGRRFDRILLDAPCTATGVIRRHPEIKWLRTADQLASAVALQQRLLEALWPLLDSGGMLVYATCSVLNRENSQQIESFLSRHPEATLEPCADATTGERQFLPGETAGDGFYYARLRRPG